MEQIDKELAIELITRYGCSLDIQDGNIVITVGK